MLLNKKMPFFFSFFLFDENKTRNVKTMKTKIFGSPINHIFSKELTRAFGQKM